MISSDMDRMSGARAVGTLLGSGEFGRVKVGGKSVSTSPNNNIERDHHVLKTKSHKARKREHLKRMASEGLGEHIRLAVTNGFNTPCFLCPRSDHEIWDCDEFMRASARVRFSRVERAVLCRECLRPECWDTCLHGLEKAMVCQNLASPQMRCQRCAQGETYRGKRTQVSSWVCTAHVMYHEGHKQEFVRDLRAQHPMMRATATPQFMEKNIVDPHRTWPTISLSYLPRVDEPEVETRTDSSAEVSCCNLRAMNCSKETADPQEIGGVPIKLKKQCSLGTPASKPGVEPCTESSVQISSCNLLTMNWLEEVENQDAEGIPLELSEEQRMVVNLETGELVTGSDVEVIPEPSTDGTHFLQHLEIAGHDCLVMYDTGSSGSVVTMDFARLAALPCIDNTEKKVTVAGDTTILSHGTFGLTLGPDWQNRKYYQLNLLGVQSITGVIPEVRLDSLEAGIRYYDTCRKGELSEEVFPSVIGGKPVDLVIGVKTSFLLPHQVYSTESGVAVSKSRLMDKNGSRIVIAGELGTVMKEPENPRADIRLGVMNYERQMVVGLPDLPPMEKEMFVYNDSEYTWDDSYIGWDSHIFSDPHQVDSNLENEGTIPKEKVKDDRKNPGNCAPPNHTGRKLLARNETERCDLSVPMMYVATMATLACGAFLAMVAYEWLKPSTQDKCCSTRSSGGRHCALCRAIADLPPRERVNFAFVNKIGERITYADARRVDVVREYVWKSPKQLRVYLIQKSQTHSVANHSKDWT